MSALANGNGLAARIAALEREIADLQAQTEGGEALQANYLIVSPGGVVNSNFSGSVGPLGAVVLPHPSGDMTGATDTAAIQGLIASGTILLAWPGTYYITGLTWLSLTAVGLIGAGKEATIFQVVGNNHVGLNFTSPAGTGGVARIWLANLSVKSGGTGNTALRLWNADEVSAERCTFSSDYLALNYQGAFNTSFRDCNFYIQGANPSPLACIWTGSGKTAPYTGPVTLSGAGALEFHDCIIESFHLAPAVLMDENTYTIKFDTCQFTAEGGPWHGMIQADGNTLQLTVDNCYQEAAFNTAGTGVDIAIGTNLGTCGAATIRNYNSTGSSGQVYAIDVAFCQRLRIDTIDGIAYSGAVINFQGLPAGTDDRHYIVENVNDGGALGTIYNSTDLSIDPSYRGDIHRTNSWKTIEQRCSLLTAAAVTGPGTFLANPFGISPIANGAPDTIGGMAFFEYDPANWEYSRIRVRVLAQSNNTACGQNLNAGLVPSTGNPAGNAGQITRTNGAFVVDTAAFSPPANTEDLETSVQAILATPGSFALATTSTGAFAAGAAVAVELALQVLQ